MQQSSFLYRREPKIHIFVVEGFEISHNCVLHHQKKNYYRATRHCIREISDIPGGKFSEILKTVTFINQLMHSIIIVVDVKIYVI
jgi:hypothetical protein